MRYKPSRKQGYTASLQPYTLQALPKKAQERLKGAKYIDTINCANCYRPTRHVYWKKNRHLVVCSNPECEWFAKVMPM